MFFKELEPLYSKTTVVVLIRHFISQFQTLFFFAVTGSAYETMVTEIMSMGFQRTQVCIDGYKLNYLLMILIIIFNIYIAHFLI